MFSLHTCSYNVKTSKLKEFLIQLALLSVRSGNWLYVTIKSSLLAKNQNHIRCIPRITYRHQFCDIWTVRKEHMSHYKPTHYLVVSLPTRCFRYLWYMYIFLIQTLMNAKETTLTNVMNTQTASIQLGGYNCTCREGCTGDGWTCEGK